MNQLPSQGRIVRYVIGFDHEGKPATCAAMVVRTWNDGHGVNLQVFVDGSNDYRSRYPVALKAPAGGDGLCTVVPVGTPEASPYTNSFAPSDVECVHGMMWRTSVRYDESKQPGTWHWPDRA